MRDRRRRRPEPRRAECLPRPEEREPCDGEAHKMAAEDFIHDVEATKHAARADGEEVQRESDDIVRLHPVKAFDSGPSVTLLRRAEYSQPSFNFRISFVAALGFLRLERAVVLFLRESRQLELSISLAIQYAVSHRGGDQGSGPTQRE